MNKFKQILTNAGEIQHWLDIFNSSKYNEILFVESHCENDRRNGQTFIPPHYEMYVWNEGQAYYMYMPEKVARFIVKGRNLKSGVSSPMARYYGWKSL